MQPYRILLVDDEAIQRQLERDILEDSGLDCDLDEAHDGSEALAKLQDASYDVVLLDKRMPVMDGDEVCRRVRQDLKKALLPLIMVTGTNSQEELSLSLAAGATDFIRKPYSPLELTARISAAVRTKRLTDQLDSAESLLFTLARMVEAKDKTTGDHCSRLSHMSVVFGRALGLGETALDALRKGGVLHDIGKLGIPDSILLKKGALTEAEWEVMRQHTEIGAHLCAGLATMREVVPIIQHHHERWDGSGYPAALRGEEIPLLARIFQIVDIYDALSSPRPYKEAYSLPRIIDLMQAETDKGWRDPHLMQAFIGILNTTPDILHLPEMRAHSRDELAFEAISATGALDWGDTHA